MLFTDGVRNAAQHSGQGFPRGFASYARSPETHLYGYVKPASCSSADFRAMPTDHESRRNLPKQLIPQFSNGLYMYFEFPFQTKEALEYVAEARGLSP